MKLFDKFFGTTSERELKKLQPTVDKINSLESQFESFSDEELKAKTEEFKERYKNGESLDSILPEAFANVREASKRVYDMRHYDVQLIGGIILHQGRIAEMKTGEGKTLVSTLPAYLNALTGDGVHIVTVNDYLAQRDASEMGKIHNFLGLSVGVILNGLSEAERQEQYKCDITYATNNELGFDYLRDNMAVYKERQVQRGLNYAIIDEVDSILIDEARTPLIITGSGKEATSLYSTANAFIKTLTPGRIVNEREALNPLIREEMQEEGDFVNDEKGKSVTLTQDGVVKAEKYFKIDNLSDPENIELQHFLTNALKANFSMKADQDYVVQDGEIVIVDEFTGRLMEGRRYSDGLHQAIEAKEGVEIKKESKTLATITFQNYFNKYTKKAGMTGTAKTEEDEFRSIYGMDVVEIPTNLPIMRIDNTDLVYKTQKAKFNAIVEAVKESNEKGQPVLVGTTTIEMSEELSKRLKREGVKHNVLNAKYHEKEAEIIADAGQKGAVTIATNMAGRGTDIKLGEGVSEVGGLRIIGTERHESRRIDNQLRGRSGRQGDVGESTFYLSLEDNLLRLFGTERVINLINAVGLPEDEAIEHKMLANAIENAQKRVEGNNFNIRKHLIDYDRVLKQQCEVIYDERARVLEGENIREHLFEMYKSIVEKDMVKYTGESDYPEEWDLIGLNEHFLPLFSEPVITITEEELQNYDRAKLQDHIVENGKRIYSEKIKDADEATVEEVERTVLLRIIDRKWMTHIDDMQMVRQGVSLRAYAQKDPLTEYKFIAYDMFDELIYNIMWETISTIVHMQDHTKPVEREQVVRVATTNKNVSKEVKQTKPANMPGRNEPCYCGSGKKYKHCCDFRG